MANDDDAWDSEQHDEIFLISQARRLLADTEAGPEAVREGEIDAPEPVVGQFLYERDSRAFLPDLSDIPRQGSFAGLLSTTGTGPPTFVLTSIHGNALPKMGEVARMLGTVRHVRGQYARVDQPPPERCFGSAEAVTRWLRETVPAFRPFILMDQRLRRARPDTPVAQAVMVIYPDEAVSRGMTRYTALLQVEEGDGQKSVRRPLYAPQVITESGAYVRIPGCEPLKEKHVAIIGCGSVGSAIATALCRVGVERFTLIDYDDLQLENLVRHECDIGQVGLAKSIALAHRLKTISPMIEFTAIGDRFGGIASPKHLSPFSDIVETLLHADLVVCATGSAAASATASGLLNSPLLLHAWVGPGGIGGRILKELPDGPCFECFRFHVPELGELPDNEEAPIYPTGCGFATFTGRMYDIELVSQWAAKIAVSTILGEDDWTAYDNAFLINNRDGTVTHRRLTTHAACSRHGSAALQRNG